MDQYLAWVQGLATTLSKVTTAVWTSLNIVSTVITVSAIWMIFTTTRHLCRSDLKVKMNVRTLLVHACLMVIQSMIYIAGNITVTYKHTFVIVWSTISFVEMIV